MTRAGSAGESTNKADGAQSERLRNGRRLNSQAIAFFVSLFLVGVVPAGALAAPTPPAGRAYEMVSPLDKNGAEIDRDAPGGEYSTSGAAADGSAVAYVAGGTFADIASGAFQAQYLSVRSEKGWVTRGIDPPLDQYPASSLNGPKVWLLSEDLRRSIVGTNALISQESPLLGGSWGLYAQDLSNPSSLSYRLLTLPSAALPPEPTLDLAAFRFSFASASSNMRHVVFESEGRRLTPDGPETGTAVYVWSDGQVRFVSRLPDGEPAGAPVAGHVLITRGQDYPGDHLVSEDGQRIFFSDVFTGALYVREHGTTTRLVSASQRTGGAPIDDPEIPRDAIFMAAEASTGSRALFQSYARLTDDATACDALCPTGLARDLYLWKAEAPAGSRLVDLTTEDVNGGGILGLAGAADDLSLAYFVATGALAPGGEAGSPNLYSWSATDGLRHVAVLDPQDAAVWSSHRDGPVAPYRDARIDGDGRRLLFVSRAPLAGIDTGGHAQVYLYDAATEQLECVSCGQGEVTGAAWLFMTPGTSGRAPFRLPRNLSADGERVFFETAQSLVATDTNGKTDVYMWSGGGLSLMSTGRGAGGSKFIDASASGDDVFFTTRERLVGADTDELVDTYDARVGGGYPEAPRQPVCAGDGCQPPAAPRPDLPDPGSSGGGGDFRRLERSAFVVGRLSAATLNALARGRRVSLVVRVNRPGRVVVRGVARGGKRATVLAATKRARGRGTVRLRLALSKPGRRRLARTGRMKVALTVRFSGVLEPKGQRLTLVRRASRGSR